MQELATQLEGACRAGSSDDEIRLRLNNTVGELKSVLDGLAVLDDGPRKTVNSAKSTQDLEPQLTHLRELLEGNAGEVMEELEHHPTLSGRRPLVAKLASAIEDYDFDQALVRLAELNKELG